MLNLTGMDLKPGPRHRPFEYYAVCPFPDCEGSTDYKLGINLKTGVYHCFRCKAKGKIKNEEEFGLLTNDIEESTQFMDIKNRINGAFTRFSPDRKSYDLDKMSDPLTEQGTPISYQYIKQRGFSDEEIQKYNLRVGKPFFDKERGQDNFSWSGRLMFPFIAEGETLFIVGRTVNGREPKYLNTATGKSFAVYGIEEVNGSECIICEGIISAIAASRATGIPAVAILGKTATTEQLSRIKAKCDKVYVSLDGGVDTSDLARQLFNFGFQTWKVDLPEDQDPDDLGSAYKDYFQKARKIEII